MDIVKNPIWAARARHNQQIERSTMSSPVKSMQVDFLSNKDNEHFFLSDDSDDVFDFKYVSKSQIKSIIRDVRRQRRCKKEEKSWASFAQEQDSQASDYSQEDADYPEVSNVKRLMNESLEEADQELRRLMKDSLPERKKSVSKGGWAAAKTASSKEDPAESPREINRTKDSARSLNMLLTIPEEINTSSACERSPISKLECSARKSHSAGVLRSRVDDDAPGEFNRATNDYERSYSSGSDNDDDDDGETCNARPHPVVAHKILGIQRKISDLLDEIALRLSRIPLPDGDRDLRRRQQRVAEFAIRFSRNYLYDLGRQIADINRHVRAITPSARVKPTRRVVALHMQAIEQKLTSAHQLLLHALSAYCQHVPSSVLKGQPGKLKEILQVVVDVREICANIHLTSDYYGCGDAEAAPLGEDTEKRCRAVLAKLRGVGGGGSDNESRLVSRTAQSSPIGGLGGRSRRVNGADNCRNFPARLAMYSSDTRLSRPNGSRKFAPPRSRERGTRSSVVGAASIRRPTTPEQPRPSHAIEKSSRDAGKRRRTRIRLPLREDEISTMMSTLATDSDAASSISISGYSQRALSIRNKAPDSAKCSRKQQPPEHFKGLNGPINTAAVAGGTRSAEKEKRVTDQQLSSLVPVIAELMTLVTNQNDVDIRPVPTESMEALMELLKRYRTSSSDVAPTTTTIEPNFDSRGSRGAKNSRESRGSTRRPSETIRGPVNMQLICLTSGENVARDSRWAKADPAVAPATTERVIASLRVNETSLKALLKYREDYQYSTRSNPMYTSNSQNKPWDVVSWIADKLVNELIDDVSEEFEIKDAIHELFALEFKEFKLTS